MTIIKLVLEVTSTGCIVPTSHALNHDGYFRKRIKGDLVLYHRHCWSLINGEIPEGYEIDHKCKNRACCNVEHLQQMTSKEHRSKDNAMRYLPEQEYAMSYWIANRCSGTELAGILGLSLSTACRWIRKWNKL